MQTVNFQCGHCGKLMGVGSEHLGQQVRCPHCQQIVIAPPPPAEPPPAPEAAPPPELVEKVPNAAPAADDADDIFAPTEASDDLFGRSAPPRIEMPPDPFVPSLPAEEAVSPPEAATEPSPTVTSPFVPPTTASPPSADGDSTAILPAFAGASPWQTGPVTETLAPPAAEEPAAPQPEPLTEIDAPAAPRPTRRREQGVPWFMILVFSPLLLYAIVITVFAVLIYRHEQELEQQFRNPFEKMPDVGDNPGVQKVKKTTWLDNYKPKFATLPLPAHLCTTLEPDGQSEPIRIGDLQITPRSVQRERVKLITENFEDDRNSQPADSLVLYLSMKNLSSEYAFAPLDNYFDRRWESGQDQVPPLTQLEVGDKYRFYGGPAKWYPYGSGDRREWVVGRKGFDPDLLQPGEEKEFFVCTNGRDAKGILALFGVNDDKPVRPAYHGQLLWRVRVRRGLVRIEDKQYSATAVVGVKFTDKAIR
ncbi:MAG TPA: hypothetical protein VH682_08335 [Gemmataceae bacterium]|jgi:DNA-directed RNA polymerase subunit RPC12/RpoP